MKVNDFAPYVEKIKASGADTVVTGAWGQDLALLLKAAGEAGLRVKWYTFFAQGIGSPTAVRQRRAAVAHRLPDLTKRTPIFVGGLPRGGKEFPRGGRWPDHDVIPDLSMRNGHVLEGGERPEDPRRRQNRCQPGRREVQASRGRDGWIRAEDHQVFQPLYVASIGPIEKDKGFDEENTGWGWRQIGEVKPEDTLVPTTCQMKRPQ